MLAESCVFGKQLQPPILCDPLLPQSAKLIGYSGAPLLPKLRGHFAEFLLQDSLEHLRILTPPTCVRLRYGHPENSHRGFSRQHVTVQFMGLKPSPSLLGVVISWICLGDPPTSLDQDNRRLAGLSLLRPPIGSLSLSRWFRNVRLISIVYASRPRLRVRLTLSGLTFLRKPWVFGERVSRPFSRYSFRHTHFRLVDQTLPAWLHPTTERSPTRHRGRILCEFAASVPGFSPAHYRREAT